jgi:hypothetical protein
MEVQDRDYVRIEMKRLTAERMVGWLHEFAEYCESDGYDVTARHAKHVAGRLLREVNRE